METIQVTRARHGWPEKSGFTVHRPRGLNTFTFLHFWNSVELLVDGKIITTAPGSCILFNIDTPQWFRSSEPLKHDWIHMTGDVVSALQSVDLQPDVLYVPANGRFITEITREIELEVLAKQPHYDLTVDVKCRELFVKLSRSCSKTSAVSSVKPATRKLLMQVRSHVFSRLDREWTVADMAALAYISPSRFYTVYRAMFGISPTEDLIRARIDNAKNHLTNSDQPVHALAEMLGYRNMSHFCRQFKQITGMTPGEFRESQRSG